MSNWTDESKAKVIKMYQDAKPTPETSTEIIKDIAEEIDQSPNGVRMILIREGVYIKKTPDAPSVSKDSKKPSEGSKRVSKESQIAALRAVIEEKGAKVDEDILDKLTGKAAAYFVEVLSSV